MSLTPGQRLGPYEILALLGAGGMGEVYRARDTKLNREVAIKVLPALFASDADRLERFTREAHTLAALNHPNIAHIHGLEDSGGVHALVMELVEGDDLTAHIARGPMRLAEALPVARQIADALEAAHEQGIVHRDLKPANVKVRADGAVKVLDFGLAKALDPTASSSAERMNSPTLTARATQMGMILGTAAYMAPEQARGKAVDRRADIWAFGVVLYEMLAGRRAFDGDDISITLASVLKDDVRWDALPASLPASVTRLLRRCLEKDPKRRLSAIGDARLELDEAAVPSGYDAPVAPALGTANGPWPRLATLALVATLGAAAVGVLAWTLKPAPTVRNVISRFLYPLPEGHAFTRNLGHNFAISPDGTKIVYIANQQLYLRAMDQLDAQPIRGTHEDPAEPVFSPDGQEIAYFVSGSIGSTSGGLLLRKVAVSGGAPVTLCETTSRPNGASWRNGLIVFGQYTATMNSIQAVAESGGTPRVLITVNPTDGRPEQPQLVDNGTRVLFTLLPTGVAMSDEGRIVVQAIAGGPPTVVVNGGMNAQILANDLLVYIRAGTIFAVPFDARRTAVAGGPVPVLEGVREVALGGLGTGQFAISEEGTLAFWPVGSNALTQRLLVWVDRQGREHPIAAKPKEYEYPRLSPDGTKVAVGQRDEDLDIWIWDFAKETLSKLTFGPDNELYPQWMPDSRRVVYRSIVARSAQTSILRKAVDGTGVDTLLNDSNGGQPNSISPDGKLLVYRTASPPYELRVLPLDGGGPSRPLLTDPKFSHANGEVSPDGRWIAYESNESGTYDVFVRPFPGVEGGRWQVSTGGGLRPLWARSSRELYFESTSPSRLMAVPIPLIPPGSAFASGRPQPLFDFTRYRTESVGRTYDVAADGRFVTSRPSDENAPAARQEAIVIVSHWFDELKARMK